MDFQALLQQILIPGDNDVSIGFDISRTGKRNFYISFLWKETSRQGHLYLATGNSFDGAFGHGWGSSWSINNSSNGVNYSFNTTYRVVAKVDFVQQETSMWIDPVDLGTISCKQSRSNAVR